MKSLLMTSFGKLDIVEDDMPICGEEEAIVRVKYAGICGSDLHIMAGENPKAKPPLILGHEVCGTVHLINSKRRKDLSIGDKVTIHAVNGCGVCDNCRNGRENLCEQVKIMGSEIDGFFREYVRVRADRLLKFNDNIDMKVAALVEPLTIAIHDVRRSGLQVGENVFIAGSGTIGILIGIVSKLSGASHVILSEIDDDRICLAKKLGLIVLDRKSKDFHDRYLNITNSKLFDRVFEVTGVEKGFKDCLAMVKPGGTLVQVGMPGKNFDDFEINRIIFNEINLLGVRNSTASSMSVAVKLINDEVLNKALLNMITVIYPKEKALEAFEKARTDKSVLKALIDFCA